MFGSGVLKGLGVTLKQFVATYVDDIKKIPTRYAGGRKELDQTEVPPEGLFTVQYPEERRKVAERFRYIPMLIYEAETGEDRCTACGICAKVCPPQCIWIVRDKDEKGKPITRPAEFYIDASICMNCGLCAEFCPFDAIKMNHDYEITAYTRMPELVFDLQELRVPTTYYASIRPTDWAEEEAARKAKEAEKAAAKPAAKPVDREVKAAAPVAPVAPAPAPAAPAEPAGAKRSPEEIERLKAEAATRRAAKAAGEGVPAEAAAQVLPAAPAEAPAAVGAKRSPEEIERLKAEAAARRAAKAAGETPVASAPETAPVAPPSEPAPSAASAGARRSPEEIERLKAEAAARRAAKAAGETPVAAAPQAAPEPPAAEPPAAPTAGVGAKRSPEEIERLKAEAAARRAAKAGQDGEQK